MSRPMNKEEVANFLAKGRILKLATIQKKKPHLIPIWYLYEDGKLFFCTSRTSKKIKNIENNNKISACVDIGEWFYDLKYVTVEGKARILRQGDAKDIAEKIMVKYLGSIDDPNAKEYLNDPNIIMVEITPTKILSEDYTIEY